MDIYAKENRDKGDKLIALLMDWYAKNQRELVWRKTQDPYAIWISEIMAQQTRITAVLPYYERFMKRFPHITELANAPLDDVLKAWEGLGYYSRAHNLLKTAKIIVEDYNGLFPSHIQLLKKLPGIGEYTAGAIASICFHKPEPAVDGNVQRVFARLYDNNMDISHPGAKKLLASFIKNLMPHEQPGLFNQSLMELGALICIPKNPLCGNCPLNQLCEAYRLNKQSQLPVKSPKKELKREDKTILLILNTKNQILLRQRTEDLLNGLWEFYMAEQEMNAKEVREHLKKLGYTPEHMIPVGRAVHTFTHKQWNMGGFQCKVAENVVPAGYKFVSVEEMHRLAMPTAIQFYRGWLVGKGAVQISLEDF